MTTIDKSEKEWIIKGGGLVLAVGRKNGCLTRLEIQTNKAFEWTHHEGNVTVRDDRIEHVFGREHLQHVRFSIQGQMLHIEKHFKGAPWRLEETYRADCEVIHWEARAIMERGDFRSCAIDFHIPWPQPLYHMSFWAAKDGMPSAPHRFAGIELEYGEITSGILMPALVSYRTDKDAGLLTAMPFDFKTPRFRFISGYREPDLRASFDWMALSPGKPARASLLLRGTGGAWRPTLGWLYERFKEYFEPRSRLIDDLWGGHVSGSPKVSLKEAKDMARLGLRWHEIHGHFPYYGEYHPEGMKSWNLVHPLTNCPKVSGINPAMIRQTIRNLHKAGSAALPYIQPVGGGSYRLGPEILERSKMRDCHGEIMSDADASGINYYLNSDPSLPFGKDMMRQIRGMVSRYPEMDGVFLDQACYNFADTAHDDGITAINNRPCYMIGFNYQPHLELLSRLLHPRKVIIGNGPHCIGIMKYIDGFMAEGSGWLCDHMQYYGLAKPMFFLVYNTSDRDIELMFQRCLIYAAGYSSYTAVMPSKNLYDRYLPLVHRLFRRRWIFDADPLRMPTGFKGNVFRSPTGTLLASVVSEEPRLRGRKLQGCGIMVKTADTEGVTRVTLQQPGGGITAIPFTKDNGAVHFDVPGDTVAAVAELHLQAKS